jgi:Zn-finger nucleic acid-binding protein
MTFDQVELFPCPHCTSGIWVDFQKYLDKKIVNHIIKCTDPTEDDLTALTAHTDAQLIPIDEDTTN